MCREQLKEIVMPDSEIENFVCIWRNLHINVAEGANMSSLLQNNPFFFFFSYYSYKRLNHHDKQKVNPNLNIESM